MNYNKMTKAELIEALKAIVSSRDLAERTLAEKRFQRLLESAPDAMVLVDNHGRIVLVNSQTETLFGYQREELLGQRVEILMPDRFRHQHTHHRANKEPRLRAVFYNQGPRQGNRLRAGGGVRYRKGSLWLC